MIARPAAALVVAVALLGGTRGAERWELEIVGPATVEHGEMRFEGGAGRIVLESADSFFVPLAALVRTDSSISFTVAKSQRRFTGRITGHEMRGTMRDVDGSTFAWDAQQILAGSPRWPVPPRLTVRQLETGSDLASVTVPGAWRARLLTDRQVVAEYDSVTHRAGIVAWHGSELRARAAQLQLGLDRPVREAIRRTLEAVERSPAATPRFRALFLGTRGLRLDLHDMALEAALRIRPTFDLGRALSVIWKITPGTQAPLDSTALREISWRFWSRLQNERPLADALDSLRREDPAGTTDALVLMRGYDEAEHWWLDATDWLMEQPWIGPPAQMQSPVALVRRFWDDDSLALPRIVTQHYAAPEAFPVPSMAPIIHRLIRPANAIAADWLAANDPEEVLAAWRRLDWGEPFRVVTQGRSRYLTSPAVEARTHAGGLLALESRILIDPGVPPLLAVATLVHEWQHLILADRRLRGRAPGVRENADQVQLLEDNAWLAEGAAEWATDEILAPAAQGAPIVLAIGASRRLAIEALTRDDPHALGYRLVRAAATRAGRPRLVRDRLTAWLHDLGGFARVSGLAGKGNAPPLVLVRPVNAAVIPEVTFVLDGGAALDVHRRLRVSLSPLEH